MSDSDQIRRTVSTPIGTVRHDAAVAADLIPTKANVVDANIDEEEGELELVLEGPER